MCGLFYIHNIMWYTHNQSFLYMYVTQQLSIKECTKTTIIKECTITCGKWTLWLQLPLIWSRWPLSDSVHATAGIQKSQGNLIWPTTHTYNITIRIMHTIEYTCIYMQNSSIYTTNTRTHFVQADPTSYMHLAANSLNHEGNWACNSKYTCTIKLWQ